MEDHRPPHSRPDLVLDHDGAGEVDLCAWEFRGNRPRAEGPSTLAKMNTQTKGNRTRRKTFTTQYVQ